MECQFCKHILSTKSALKVHQNKVKYCLKIQGVNKKGEYECKLCGKDFSVKFHLQNHENICEKNIPNIKKLNEELESLRKDICILKKENEILRADKKELQDNYKELSIVAVKRPTISNKTIQVNNYIKNMTPLLISDITDNVKNLTLEHHVKGAEGYAEYALEFPFKDKIVCVDVGRNKIKYKNEDGDVVEDVGFRKMMIKLCSELKDRSFNLSQEHYDKLSDTFTEKEVDDYNFMEAAIAISKFANGRESEFCNQMVKMISRSVSKGV
jgi:hypothetical protein